MFRKLAVGAASLVYDNTVYAYNKTRDFLEPYNLQDTWLVSKVSPIVKAIYNLRPVSNFVSGFSKVFSLPGVLEKSPQGRNVIVRSFEANIVRYLNPVVANRMLMNFMYRENTEENATWNNIVLGVDVAINILLIRLFVRRLKDNGILMLCLPKGIGNDLISYLANQMSDLFCARILPKIDKIFFNNIDLVPAHKEKFKEQIYSLFKKFFSQFGITQASFAPLIKQLRDILVAYIKNMGANADEKEIKIFCAQLAKTNIDELSICFSDDFIKRVTEGRINFDSAISKKLITINEVANEKVLDVFSAKIDSLRIKNKGILTNALSKDFKFSGSLAESTALDLVQASIDTRVSVQSYLPIQYGKPCVHGLGKQVIGEVASPAHYQIVMLCLLIPELLLWLGSINPNAYNYLSSVATALRILYWGHSVDEYKTAASGAVCTTDRHAAYDTWHSYGVGYSLVFLAKPVKWVANYLMGGPSFFVDDAVENFALHLGSATSIANNKPLPGQTELTGGYIFSGPRRLTKKIGEGIKACFSKKIQSADDCEKSVAEVKDGLMSPVLHNLLRLLFSGSDFSDDLFPKKEIWLETYAIFSEKFNKFIEPHKSKKIKEKEAKEKQMASAPWITEAQLREYQLCRVVFQCLDRLGLTDPIKNKKQKNETPLDLAFGDPTIHLLFRVFHRPILDAIDSVEKARSWTLWLENLVIPLPIINYLSSLFAMPITVLKDEDFKQLLAKVRLNLSMVRDIEDLTGDVQLELVRETEVLRKSSKVGSGVKIEELVPEKPRRRDEKLEKPVMPTTSTNVIQLRLYNDTNLEKALSKAIAEDLVFQPRRLDVAQQSLLKPQSVRVLNGEIDSNKVEPKVQVSADLALGSDTTQMMAPGGTNVIADYLAGVPSGPAQNPTSSPTMFSPIKVSELDSFEEPDRDFLKARQSPSAQRSNVSKPKAGFSFPDASLSDASATVMGFFGAISKAAVSAVSSTPAETKQKKKKPRSPESDGYEMRRFN